MALRGGGVTGAVVLTGRMLFWSVFLWSFAVHGDFLLVWWTIGVRQFRPTSRESLKIR
jgi:hypothetical protein